jgi:hypothetical protein
MDDQRQCRLIRAGCNRTTARYACSAAAMMAAATRSTGVSGSSMSWTTCDHRFVFGSSPRRMWPPVSPVVLSWRRAIVGQPNGSGDARRDWLAGASKELLLDASIFPGTAEVL